MDNIDLIKTIVQKNDKKILLVVIDGLGGISNPKTGKTELRHQSSLKAYSFANMFFEALRSRKL